MRHYLVVANQTLGGRVLTEDLAQRCLEGTCTVRLVVPVTETDGTHDWDYPVVDRFVPDPRQVAHALAAGRLELELQRLARLGVEAAGEVVDADPVGHVRALAQAESVDEVIVATLPEGLSRWLRLDLPHRLARAVSVPVTHLSADAGPSL